MKQKLSLTTCLLTALGVALVVFMATYTALSERYRAKLAKAYTEADTQTSDTAGGESPDGETAYEAKLRQIDALFSEYAYYDLDKQQILDGILSGYAYGTGDRYAEYYNEEAFEALREDDGGEMQGIGISIIDNAEYHAIEVISVMPESPALAAGVQPGDLIVTVGQGEDAEDVAELGYYPAVALLQGKAGTLCEFTALRGKDYEEVLTFSIERGFVKEETVMYHICETDSTVGIIKLLEFDAGTPGQFCEAVDTLIEAGAQYLVFDVRYNPGGELNSVSGILDFLLPEGPIIHIRDKNGREQTLSSDASELSMPMAVLCNGNTASAAELFTSALMDYQKAFSVGEVTYGKGCMQTVFPLGDGTGLKLTTKMYFPPFSEGYDGIGITPNFVVAMDEALAEKNIYKITDAEDTQLQVAISHLHES